MAHQFISIGTGHDDTTPDAFSFTDQTNVTTSATITSAGVTITGLTGIATIAVSGGTYDINGSGTFTSAAGTVVNGDVIRARHTSSGSAGTTTNTVVTIGGVSDTFSSTTAAAAGTSWFEFTFANGSSVPGGNFEPGTSATIDTTRAPPGATGSLRTTIASGNAGSWGFEYLLPQSGLAHGDKFWIQFWTRYDDDTDFYTDTPASVATDVLKFVRLLESDSLGSAVGHADWLIAHTVDGGVEDPNGYMYQHEVLVQPGGSQPQHYYGGTSGHHPRRGIWQKHEIYIELKENSTGTWRHWVNNQLVGEITNFRTMVDADNRKDRLLIHNEWNTGSPKTQSMNIGLVKAYASGSVGNGMPANVDSNGNVFIGDESGGDETVYAHNFEDASTGNITLTSFWTNHGYTGVSDNRPQIKQRSDYTGSSMLADARVPAGKSRFWEGNQLGNEDERSMWYGELPAGLRTAYISFYEYRPSGGEQRR